MKVLVTGGAGFIGANLCQSMLERAEISEVVVLDDLSTGSATNLVGTDVTFVEGSILDRPLVDDLVGQVDAVVHLAARPSVPRSLADPVTSHLVNATGTLYVLEACRAAGAYVVAASSSSVYGSVIELPRHEELATRPLSPYAASKLATEAYVLAYATSFDLPTLAFRFFNVYGPLQAAGHAYAAVVPAFLDAALRGEPVQVHGDGHQTRDFTYVGTLCEVLTDAVVRRVVSDAPVNLAFGARVSLLSLIDHMSAQLGTVIPVEHGPVRRGDVRDSQASNGRLRSLFPDVRPVPLEIGLKRTLDWFRAGAAS
ncbi:MAG TPA: NAD-dependent epimerase/dehydratase family protein [Micromonosporaceae bacterium]|nr:NAD-dependent epimerase/dehydratase family protein [Micromonosporaceae bacterium]